MILAHWAIFDIIDQISSQVKGLEKVLSDLVCEDEDVALLQTIPGVGLITAATIRAYTDDINKATRSMLHMPVWYRGFKTPTRPFVMVISPGEATGIENGFCPDGDGDAAASE
jgi:hypothetical protein